MLVADNTFTDNDGLGAWIDATVLTVENNSFTGNATGLELRGAVNTLRGNTYSANTYAGLSMWDAGQITLEGETITGNPGVGVTVRWSERDIVLSGDTATPTRICGNSGFSVRGDDKDFDEVSSHPLAVNNVDARNVDWGMNSANVINATIFDLFDDTNYGLVVHEHLPIVGNTDDDFDVDITDFTVLATNFDPRGVNPLNNVWEHGNFDADDDIDITDFHFVAKNFVATTAVFSVPEPSSIVVHVSALVGVLSIARCLARKPCW